MLPAGSRREWPIIDVSTLDQEKGIASFLSEASDLGQQTPSNQAAVQVEDALPFYERFASDVVISDSESLDAN